MAKIISVLSGKGGVGKTLITGAIGIKLARDGKRVLLIDGDMGLRNLDLIFGIENDCFYNIWDLAQGRCFAGDAVINIDKNIDFLAAAQSETWEDIFPAAIDTVIEDIGHQYDYILLDCPAGLGNGITFAANISELAIIIVAASWASKRSAEKIYSFLPSKLSSFMVLNQFSEHDNTQISFSTMMKTVDEELFGGVIPYSMEADRLGHKGHLQDYEKSGAFGEALTCVINTVLHNREYPMTKWESILHLANKENKLPKEKSLNSYKDRKDMWDNRRMAYKWRRRR